MLLRSGKPVVLAVNKMDSSRSGRTRISMSFTTWGWAIPIASVRRPRPRHRRSAGRLLPVSSLEEEEETEDDDVHQGGHHRQAQRGKVLPGQPHFGPGAGHRHPMWRAPPGTQWTAILKTRRASTSSSIPPGCGSKSKVDDRIEKFSVLRATMAIERSDVCLIMIDAQEGVTEQDTKVAGLAHEAGKACIIVVNKWDAVEKDGKTMDKMRGGHPPGPELYDLRPHPLHLRPHRPAGGPAL